MLQALRRSRNEDALGAYYDFLHDVADFIPDEDLPMVLAWLADHLEGNFDDFAWAAMEIIERAWIVWTQSGSEPLLLALAVLLCRIQNTVGLSTVLWRPTPWLDAAQAPRLPFAIAVAEQLGATGEWRELYQTFLVEPADADALLDTLPGRPQSAQLPLVSCVAEIASWEPTRESADRILTLPPDHPAYEATAELREPCPLDPTTGRHWRHPRRRLGADRRRSAVRRRARGVAASGAGLRKTQALRLLVKVGELAPTATAAACRRLQGQGGELGTYASQLRCRLDPSAVVREWLRTDPCDQDLLELVPFLDDTRLDLREVGQLSKLLLDRFHIAETGRLCDVHDRGMPFDTCWRRDILRKRLAESGAVEQLEQLSGDRPEPDLAALRSEVRLARANAADQALVPLEPAQPLGQL